MTELTEGTKHDLGKLRWELVPPEFEEVVKVLTYGANKYAARNWEQGILYSRIIGATFRHIWAWIKGKRNDPETGFHHLSHAICELLFLLTYESRGMVEFDDRVKIYEKRVGEGVLSPSGDGLQPDLFTAKT
jgi:hypothetical protein